MKFKVLVKVNAECNNDIKYCIYADDYWFMSSFIDN